MVLNNIPKSSPLARFFMVFFLVLTRRLGDKAPMFWSVPGDDDFVFKILEDWSKGLASMLFACSRAMLVSLFPV